MIWKIKKNFILKGESLEKLSSPMRRNAGEKTPTQTTQSEELCTKTVSILNLKYIELMDCVSLKYLIGKDSEEEKEGSTYCNHGV